jgi:hypothetical protein
MFCSDIYKICCLVTLLLAELGTYPCIRTGRAFGALLFVGVIGRFISVYLSVRMGRAFGALYFVGDIDRQGVI